MNNNANIDQIRFDNKDLLFYLFLSIHGEQIRIPIDRDMANYLIETHKHKHEIQVSTDREFTFWVFNPAKSIPFAENTIKG